MRSEEAQEHFLYTSLNETAIPEGRYPLVMTKSMRFKKWLSLLLGVPGFSGEIFLAQRLPFHILVCHCFLLLFIYDIMLNVSIFDRKNSKIIRNDKKYRKKKNAIHISTPFFWMYQIKALTLQKIARRYVDI